MSDSSGAVTLARAKAYLRVTHGAEDELISNLINAATAQAEQICGREIVKRDDDNALVESIEDVPTKAPGVHQWILMCVADFYEKRGASESPVATGRRYYDHLLDPYRLFG